MGLYHFHEKWSVHVLCESKDPSFLRKQIEPYDIGKFSHRYLATYSFWML